MSTISSTRRRRGGAALLATALLVLAGASAAEAAVTTPSCLAKRLNEWGKLRKCQASEHAKGLPAKPFDAAKCQTKFNDRLAKLHEKAAVAAIACRYGVNTGAAAGTVTDYDYDTGLQWEQKTDDGTVHDKDNLYFWNTVFPGTTPNGTAFTEFLRTLNNGTSGDGSTTSGCFAGHCDWRLPAIEKLAGIVDVGAPGCGGGSPCIDRSAFGPTVPSFYWSATTLAGSPSTAFDVSFSNVDVCANGKGFAEHVRGARSGL